jgi:mannitol/fructose-specific phosphotransferase system IIA component (Ntr-type)
MLGTLAPSALDTALYIPDLRHRRKSAVFDELVDCAVASGAVRCDPALRELLRCREALGSTSPGRGFALPHARSLAVRGTRVVVARSTRGVDWGASDGELVRLIVLLLSPSECPDSAHLDLLGRLGNALRFQRQRQKMLEAAGFETITSLLREELA